MIPELPDVGGHGVGGDVEDPGDGDVGDLLLVHLEAHQLAFDLIREIWTVAVFVNVCQILVAELK